MRKTVLILILFGMILPIFSLAQSQMKPPGTLDEVKAISKEALGVIKKELPGVLENIWQESVLPVWKKMYGIFSGWWTSAINPWLQNIQHKITAFFGKEIEKRKPILEKEFEKEKKELKEDIKNEGVKASRSLWEKFKEIIQ